MAADLRAPAGATGYAAGPVTKPPPWHVLVAWDVLFNGLASGVFLVAALAELAAPKVFSPLAKAAYPFALAFLVADLVCLVLDLGDPSRFHHMLRVFKPTSPMSLGTWCLTVYAVPLTAVAALGLWPAGGPAIEFARKAAVLVALLPALGVAVYKGVLFSTTAQPGWRDARWLGGYLASSAFVMGAAGMLALAVVAGGEEQVRVLRAALAVMLLVNLVPLFLVARELQPALARAYSPARLGPLKALCVGLGTLVPLTLLLIGGTQLPVADRLAPLAAVVSALAGRLAVRVAILRLPHAS